jgi:hypothetical protein
LGVIHLLCYFKKWTFAIFMASVLLITYKKVYEVRPLASTLLCHHGIFQIQEKVPESHKSDNQDENKQKTGLKPVPTYSGRTPASCQPGAGFHLDYPICAYRASVPLKILKLSIF